MLEKRQLRRHALWFGVCAGRFAHVWPAECHAPWSRPVPPACAMRRTCLWGSRCLWCFLLFGHPVRLPAIPWRVGGGVKAAWCAGAFWPCGHLFVAEQPLQRARLPVCPDPVLPAPRSIHGGARARWRSGPPHRAWPCKEHGLSCYPAGRERAACPALPSRTVRQSGKQAEPTEEGGVVAR